MTTAAQPPSGMTPLAFLLSAEGDHWLAEAAGLPLTDKSRLADLTQLRRGLPPELAGAVLEQATLRQRGLAKFARAASMLFTPDGLQQASAEPVARHRAARFAGRRIVDLTCGIGGDTLALATTAESLVALDRDADRLRIARHNVAAHDGAAAFVRADLLAPPLASDPALAFFCDPGRRGAEGRRIFRPEDYEPPLDAVLDHYGGGDLGVKVAPGIDYDALPENVREVEIVSLGGDVKEAVLWCGGLAMPGVRRRATLIPEAVTLTDADAPDTCPVGPPNRYLYEPDGAVIRAGLVRPLAHVLGLAQIDPHLAYLTGPDPVQSPFARGFVVDERHPFNLKALNRRLSALQVGTVELKKRGIALEPEALRPRLKLGGSEARTVIFTRLGEEPIMLICRALETVGPTPTG
ncbi:MAG TPA: class I SAM-dependent methyltransferase [Chloroflexia bacterium]|nr:class I SAM-dependent methyltransferase [Chloroflexia bacterium]